MPIDLRQRSEGPPGILLFAFGQLYEVTMASASKFGLAVVVDDDPDIALAARLVLRAEFAEIVTLTHPEALMPLLDRAEPDVILLDLNFERGATDGAEGFRWLPRILAKDPDAAMDDYGAWRTDDCGRRDQAWRGGLRHQAVGQ